MTKNKIISTKLLKFPKSRSDAKKLIKILQKFQKIGCKRVYVADNCNNFIVNCVGIATNNEIYNGMLGHVTMSLGLCDFIYLLSIRVLLKKPFNVKKHFIEGIRRKDFSIRDDKTWI